MMLHTLIDSPLGAIQLRGDVTHLSGLYFADAGRLPPLRSESLEDSVRFESVANQLAEYFAGTRQHFTTPLALVGTKFQRRVWAELATIGYGETLSYAEVARRIGLPDAFRAVGSAIGSNPISIVVPCHRVIGAAGDLVGYGSGIHRKRALLELEGAIPRPPLRLEL